MKQFQCLILFSIIFVHSNALAQLVDIPDPNLRTAIIDALKLPRGTHLTEEHMRQLKELDVLSQNITSISGLEFASNLKRLQIADNPIDNIRPIAGLTKLINLSMWAVPHINIAPLSGLTSLHGLDVAACRITDITPLATLINLRGLNIRGNQITDIRPLANLKHLTHLHADNNWITDVTPLAALPHLEWLEIHHNSIIDHTPLDALALSHFTYDQTCDMPPIPLEPRVENRSYPSIFTRHGGGRTIENLPGASYIEKTARHDLWIDSPRFNLEFQHSSTGFAIAGDLDEAIRTRDEYLAINPNMVFIVDIRMREEWIWDLPDDSPYWLRDANGNRVGDWPDAYLLDFTDPFVQDRIVQQAIAVSKCGLYDGIYFDYWSEQSMVLRRFRTMEQEQQARDIILHRIRAATRPNFLISGNVNNTILPRTAPYVNGGIMETVVPFDKEFDNASRDFNVTAGSLSWLDRNLRRPGISGPEGWSIPTQPPASPDNRRWMRAFTTLSLTHSDGYISFLAKEGGGGHWYNFWDADLGRPVGEKGQLYQEADGLYIREFTNGWAVYNHSGGAQVITLPEEAQGVASGLVNTEHALPNLDGEMYLRVKPVNPSDVNEDGVVNILDLILVAQAIGTEKSEPDVNGDGVINVFDLVMVAGAIGGGGAAPSAYSPDPSMISAADVTRWLAQAQGLGVGDATFQRGIRFLQQLLAALTPKETALLPNYPNPFNPETWIPYRLAQGVEVAITIYDTKGTLVRRLALGNQSAGHYAERGKAAYWDGRNEGGEVVASGIYIYQFRAGDYAASRRLVIVK